MAKLSTTTAETVSMGTSSEAAAELGGYKVSYVQTADDVDLTPLLEGLPGDQCSCPHWGYVISGEMWFRSAGAEETFGPGDAFYVAGGHTSGARAGAEFVVFSPTEEMAPIEAHMMRRAHELQSLAS